MAKRVIFEGNDVIVEDIKIGGYLGNEAYVTRRHLTREEYNKEVAAEQTDRLGAMTVAGILAGGALLLQKYMDKGNEKDNKSIFANIKLPWSK